MSRTRNQKRQDKMRILLILSVIVWAAFVLAVLAAPTASGAKDVKLHAEEPKPPEPLETAFSEVEEEEDYENEQIEAALLERAHKIDGCTVTWYTSDTCNKRPGDPGYGITASGLPVVEHLTCAVDTSVIPLYSDVFVQYTGGIIEQLWATDTGVKGNAIDIYTPDYDYAIQCGRQKLTVWWLCDD